MRNERRAASSKRLCRTLLGLFVCLLCALEVSAQEGYGQDPYGDYYGDDQGGGGWDYPGYQDYADDGYEDSLYEKYAASHQEKGGGGG